MFGLSSWKLEEFFYGPYQNYCTTLFTAWYYMHSCRTANLHPAHPNLTLGKTEARCFIPKFGNPTLAYLSGRSVYLYTWLGYCYYQNYCTTWHPVVLARGMDAISAPSITPNLTLGRSHMKNLGTLPELLHHLTDLESKKEGPLHITSMLSWGMSGGVTNINLCMKCHALNEVVQ